jgi:hypothetical protein
MSRNRNDGSRPRDFNDREFDAEWPDEAAPDGRFDNERETASEDASRPQAAAPGERVSSQQADAHRNSGARPRETIIPPVAPEAETDTGQSCIMIGPAASGKTTLLTAIKRACDLPSQDGLNLEFIPEKATAEKIKTAIDKITNRQEGHPATGDVRNYPFEVHVSAKAPNFWSQPLEADLHIVMSDGGGGFLLPTVDISKDVISQDNRNQLINEALNATSMILCVDITRPGSTLLEKELAISFAEMARPIVFSSPVHWTTQLWSKLQRRPIPPGRARRKRCLNVDRFLLLLTQVDKLCYRLPSSIDRTIRFAEMIEPVEQARDLLGVPVLKTIQSFLKPGARFAVGVISAMGFHPLTGDPFADVDGTPLNLASESGEDILRRWTPYGIRDAIYFLATGECRGTVKELTPGYLMSGAEPLEFSYSTNHQKEV